MAKKRKSGASVNLDSFLDIICCLVGVLILMIIQTGLEASQIRLLVQTPMGYDSGKRPIFIECRNNQLFLVPVRNLHKLAEERLNAIAEEAGGDTEKFLNLVSQASVRTEHYEVDLTYKTLGQLTLYPVTASPQGYAIETLA